MQTKNKTNLNCVVDVVVTLIFYYYTIYILHYVGTCDFYGIFSQLVKSTTMDNIIIIIYVVYKTLFVKTLDMNIILKWIFELTKYKNRYWFIFFMDIIIYPEKFYKTISYS